MTSSAPGQKKGGSPTEGASPQHRHCGGESASQGYVVGSNPPEDQVLPKRGLPPARTRSSQTVRQSTGSIPSRGPVVGAGTSPDRQHTLFQQRGRVPARRPGEFHLTAGPPRPAGGPRPPGGQRLAGAPCSRFHPAGGVGVQGCRPRRRPSPPPGWARRSGSPARAEPAALKHGRAHDPAGFSATRVFTRERR